MTPPVFKAAALSLLALLSTVVACGGEASFSDKAGYANRRSGASGAQQSGDAVPNPVPNGEDSTAGDINDPDAKPAVLTSILGVPDSAQAQNGAPADAPQETSDVAAATTPDPVKPGDEGAVALPPAPTPPKPGSEGQVATPHRKSREISVPAQIIGNATVTKDLAGAYLTTDITLTRSYADRTKQLTQIDRPTTVDRFDQGNYGARETQTFDQIANRPLDIVVVIDDSGSMAEEQGNMATKLAPLLSYVQDADWQIGVVTTDPDEGCLRKLIRKGDADPQQLFAQAVTAGTGASGNERGVLQAVRALAGTCAPQPWIRSDSTVAVLIVSDEDNCSANGGDCPGKDYGKANYLFDYLASIREPGKNARVYGLIWHPSQTHPQCASAGNVGTQYADLIARTSGTWGSICASDYTATLSQMSKDIMIVLNTKFTLTYAPDPASLHVFLGPTEFTTGIKVTGKVVELTPAPPVGSRVTINYRHDPTPLETTFALRHKPDPRYLTVSVDETLMPPGAYQVNVGGPSVEFAQPPAEYAKIVVSYTQGDQALTQQFAMNEPLVAGSLTVRINGAPAAGFAVAASTGTVTFAAPPPDGAVLDFAYRAVGPPILRYPFAPAYDMPQDLEAFDAATGATLAVTLDPGFVTIGAADFGEGRRLTLRYDNLARQTFGIDLPSAPLAGTITATGGPVVCRDPAHLVLQGNTLTVGACGFAADVATVRVSYRYVVEDRREFTVSLENLPKNDEFQQWAVWVDGVPRADFHRSGDRIGFDQALPFGAVVKIQLTQEGN